MTKEWKLTNGDFDIPLCDTCAQPIYSGHVDCTCPTNHPDDCKRPTYDALTASHASLVAALADLQPCSVCGELASHTLHLDDPHGWENMASQFECNYDASYEGEETGWVGTCDHHEFEGGCYCEQAGKCSVCVEKRADQFDAAYDAYVDATIERLENTP